MNKTVTYLYYDSNEKRVFLSDKEMPDLLGLSDTKFGYTTKEGLPKYVHSRILNNEMKIFSNQSDITKEIQDTIERTFTEELL